MKKIVYYQIHKSANKSRGCLNNDFAYPSFKLDGGISSKGAGFNENVEAYVMNDHSRLYKAHGGVYSSKVPYSLISLKELQLVNQDITRFHRIMSSIELIIGIIF